MLWVINYVSHIFITKTDIMNTEIFIKKSKEVHGDKYDYSKVEYINTKTKVCVICPKHGEFMIRPNDHLQGHGCRRCAVDSRREKNILGYNGFIEKAKEVHDGKYDYSKVEYVNNHTNVRIVCPVHGEFMQQPGNHLQGQGCPICGRKNAAEKLKKNISIFIEKAKEVHGDKYDYSKVEYVNNETKICIICPEHGEFWQTPSAHLRGQGCPDCNNSTLESEMLSIVNGMGISNKRYSNINGILGNQSVDFYLDKEGVAIECQGIQHFIECSFFKDALNDEIERDLKKKEICEANGISVKYYIRRGIVNKYNIFNNKIYKNIYNKNNIIYG